MQGVLKIIPAFALAFTIMALPNSAAAISSATGPAPWGEFAFDGLGSTSMCVTCIPSDGNNSFFLGSPPWIFTGSGFLIVQDAFIIGDQFRVFDNNVAIGDTSAPIGNSFCGSDPDDCFADPNASRGVFALGDIAHSFTIEVIQAPSGAGAGFLCISSSPNSCLPVPEAEPVPEPMSMILLGLGLAVAFVWAQRPQLRRIRALIARKRQRRL